MTMGAPPLRKTAGPVTLLRTALGGPRELAEKARRVRRTLALVLDAQEIDRRLTELQRQGFVRQRPNRYQLAFGGLDMLRWVIAPASQDFCAQQGISFPFQQGEVCPNTEKGPHPYLYGSDNAPGRAFPVCNDGQVPDTRERFFSKLKSEE